jgi:hypothetical protein
VELRLLYCMSVEVLLKRISFVCSDMGVAFYVLPAFSTQGTEPWFGYVATCLERSSA